MSPFFSHLLSLLPSVRGLEGIREVKGSRENNSIKYPKVKKKKKRICLLADLKRELEERREMINVG